MSFLVDTDICSAYMKGDRRVWQRFMQYNGRLHISAITVGELFTWVSRAKAPPQRQQGFLNLIHDIIVLDVTAEVGQNLHVRA